MRQLIKEVRIKLLDYKLDSDNRYPISYSQDFNGLLQKNNIIISNPMDFSNNVMILPASRLNFEILSMSCSFIELASDDFFFLRFDQNSQVLKTKSFSYFGESKLTNIAVANGTLIFDSVASTFDINALSREVSIKSTIVT